MSLPVGFAVLRLDRPQRGNAMSAEMVERLLAGVQQARHDAHVHTLLFLADGPHFCTGFDLSDLDEMTDATLLHRFVRIEQLLDAVWKSPLRTGAIAHGRTWGAGADLFAACDVRLAAHDTVFRFPGAGFGLVLGTRRLAERVGRDMARHCTVDGGHLDASQAVAAGLATAIVEPMDWPALEAFFPTPAVSTATAAQLRHATCADHSDGDLAQLVRSAAHPGLKARIEAYRARATTPRDGTSKQHDSP